MKPKAPKGKRSRTTMTDTRNTELYLQVERVHKSIERLSQSPATTEELAGMFKVSHRTITRFMAALSRAGYPIYTRRSPDGQREPQWTLDLETYLLTLQKKKKGDGIGGD